MRIDRLTNKKGNIISVDTFSKKSPATFSDSFLSAVAFYSCHRYETNLPSPQGQVGFTLNIDGYVL